MKKLITTLMAVGTIAFAGGNISPVEPVVAEDSATTGAYVGLGLGSTWTYTKGNFDFSSDVAGESYIDPMLGINLGYTFYTVGAFDLSAEGRILASYNANDFDTTVYSAYLKPKYTFTDYGFGVYGLLGLAHVRWNDGAYSVNKTGFSFGLGAEYQITKRVSVSADWTSNIWNKEVDGVKNLNNDVVMVWLNYKF